MPEQPRELSPPPRPVLFEARHALPEPLSLDELSRVRCDFLVLMDAAAVAVQRAGYDLDDCIVERRISMSSRDHPHVITLDAVSLTDPAVLAAAFRDAHARQGGPLAPQRALQIIAVHVRAQLDNMA